MSCVDMSASKHLTHDVDNTCCDWHRLLVLWGTHEERNHRSICVTTIASTYVSYKLHIILIWVMPWPSLAHLSLHKHGGGKPLATPHSYNLRVAHLPPAHGSYMAYVQLTCAPSPLHHFAHHPSPLWTYMNTIYVSLSRRSGFHLLLPEENSKFQRGVGETHINIYIYIYLLIYV